MTPQERETMQMALDVLDDINQCSLEPTGIPLPAEIDEAMDSLRAALAQPEQEPVAWGFQNTGITGSNRWMYLRETIPTEDQYRGVLWTPLYTAPPQREWQGLTDEDIEELRHLIDWTAGWSYGNFARAIEAKLMEKNFDRPS